MKAPFTRRTGCASSSTMAPCGCVTCRRRRFCRRQGTTAATTASKDREVLSGRSRLSRGHRQFGLALVLGAACNCAVKQRLSAQKEGPLARAAHLVPAGGAGAELENNLTR